MNNPNSARYPGAMVRPKTTADLLERMQYFRSVEARAAVDQLDIRPDDTFIATYSKSGTTWMQQVVHQVRTGGDVHFSEISAVVPWIESALDLGMDPAADQPGGFRAFKSHLSFSELPKGARYITVFRNPRTVLTSFYRFFEGWMFEAGTINLEEFAESFYFEGTEAGRHWNHFVDWWPEKDSSRSLVLSYEDMVEEADSVPELVADFLGLCMDAETCKQVIENCSRQYMVSNVRQFDDHIMREIQDPLLGIPPGGDASKVTDGNKKLILSDQLIKRLDEIWQEVVTPSLGFINYEEMRSAMPNPLGANR